MRWQKTEAPLACRAAAAVDTQERLDPRVKCGLWRSAYHSNRCIGFRRIVPGCLGRAYRDVHHPIDQLGCSAGQEGDGLGEHPRGIFIITTLPRP